MDYRDTAEEAAFRAELRAWLEATAPKNYTQIKDYNERNKMYRQFHRNLYEAGYMGMAWPVEYGGRGLSPIYDAILNEEAGRSSSPPIPGHGQLPGPGHLHLRERGAEDPVPPHPAQRGRGLVPGVQRARRRVRPGLAADPGRARRGRLRGQRSEDVDQRGAVCRLVPAAGADRSRRAQAQGHLVPAGGHALSGDRRTAHRAERRRPRDVRGLLGQRAGAGVHSCWARPASGGRWP